MKFKLEMSVKMIDDREKELQELVEEKKCVDGMVEEKNKQNRELRKNIEEIKTAERMAALKWTELEKDSKRKGVENGQ